VSEPVFFLDVNVPMYAAGKPHPRKEACVWLLTEIANQRLPVAIDTEIIQEVLSRYGALERYDLAVEMASNLLDLIPTVLPVGPKDVQRAVHLFEQYAPEGVKGRDVLHAAVMQTNGLTKIISMDNHFDRIVGITRLDPQALFEAGGWEDE
jgi:hypothetical protein